MCFGAWALAFGPVLQGAMSPRFWHAKAKWQRIQHVGTADASQKMFIGKRHNNNSSSSQMDGDETWVDDMGSGWGGGEIVILFKK